MKKLLFALFFVLPVMNCFAQSSDADEGDPSADLLLGAGISNEGLAYGACMEMNAFGITLGARGSLHGGAIGLRTQEVKEFGVLAGYGCRKGHMSVSVTGGYSLSFYKCTSSDSYECSRYDKGSYWGPTGQLKLVGHCSQRTGIGVLGFGNFNKREDIYGAMLMFDLVF